MRVATLNRIMQICTMPVRVTLFEDNAARREGVKLLLNASDGFTCAGAFENCNNVLPNITATNPDVVLMDIEMPGMNGIDAVKMIKQAYPQLPVMMQTVFDVDEKIFQSILAGATGYLLKKTTPSRLLESIRELHEGGAPMTPEVAIKVLQYFKQAASTRVPDQYALSLKEKEVLLALVDGLSYKMIAGKLQISYHTVNFHIRNIYQKLHVHSVSEAVAKAIREKLTR